MAIHALDYRTNQPIAVDMAQGKIVGLSESYEPVKDNFYIAPGLVDLQINGFKGIDFNTLGLSISDIATITNVLFEKGITTYFPTLITNKNTTIDTLIKTIVAACKSNELINACIGGIHLEGPFLSAEDGPRGAHPLEHIKAPDWSLFSKWQNLAEGKIRIITLSPEWPESEDFIKCCVSSNVSVSIGHTSATPEQIRKAIDAGATMSTHLGNASHAMLPRHANYVWEQLASDALWSTLIADGFHLPDALLKIFLKVKPDKSILVSDATSYADFPTGSYSGHIGGDVILDKTGRLHMAQNYNMLAGSAQSLLWCVNQLVCKKICTLSEAWNMASIKPLEAIYNLKSNEIKIGDMADLVLFNVENGTLKIHKTYKSGNLMFSN